LLEQLRDDAPGESREPIQRRAWSARQQRDSVIRDLSWLLNCTRLSALQDLSAFPEARISVIDYGLPALAGSSVESLDDDALKQVIKQAILTFEPRIRPETLSVEPKKEAGQGAQSDHRIVAFEISGEVVVEPARERLYLETELDLDTGKLELRSRAVGD
jgi:type VI secretion system protein ImpF